MIKVNPRNIVLHFCIMMAFWLILSGYFDLFHISLGVLSVSTVLWFNAKLRNHVFYPDKKSEESGLRVFRFFYFLIFLLWEIITSSFRIAYLIIHPKMPIKTGIIKFKTNLPNMFAKVTLGNSISLTPGTVTLHIDGDNFVVHALTSESDEAHIDHSLAVEVAKLYKTKIERVVCDEVIIDSEDEL
ncbi:MAG: Na+/H+ antiporter subunit E [Melioribacteraceae bacterium]|nr:Na+/H+ antiporter subunit E [Melioribacteraceae bacterium]